MRVCFEVMSEIVRGHCVPGILHVKSKMPKLQGCSMSTRQRGSHTSFVIHQGLCLGGRTSLKSEKDFHAGSGGSCPSRGA